MPTALILLFAYLVGAIPFGLLIARHCCGVDIRQRGSGNIGATNVGRELGWRWGGLVLLLDALKGLLPTLAPLVMTDVVLTDAVLTDAVLTDAAGTSLQNLMLGCGIAAVIGHMFPVYLGFRGGKGVATGLGVAAGALPWPTLAAFVVFVVLTLLLRYVGLSSTVAALTFAIVQLLREGGTMFTAERWPVAAFSLGVPALIVFRHRGNLARLFRGEEPKTYGTPKPATPAVVTPVAPADVDSPQTN